MSATCWQVISSNHPGASTAFIVHKNFYSGQILQFEIFKNNYYILNTGYYEFHLHKSNTTLNHKSCALLWMLLVQITFLVRVHLPALYPLADNRVPALVELA